MLGAQLFLDGYVIVGLDHPDVLLFLHQRSQRGVAQILTALQRAHSKMNDAEHHELEERHRCNVEDGIRQAAAVWFDQDGHTDEHIT